jgi:hypothetical protein
MNRRRLLATGIPDVIRTDPKFQEIYLGSDHAESAERKPS